MVRDAENDAKSEALRAMQAEGQKLADALESLLAAWRTRNPSIRPDDLTFAEHIRLAEPAVEALAAWGMVKMGFERHEPPGEVELDRQTRLATYRQECEAVICDRVAMGFERHEPPGEVERLRAMQAEGQKLADLLRGVWYLTYPGTLAECGNEVDAALSEWGMVVMGFERHEPPSDAQG
jgi:hypothetical protein